MSTQKDIHIIINGRSFDRDGNNFIMAAANQKLKIEKKYCSKLINDKIAYNQCKNNIIVFDQMKKDRFLKLLALLPNKSLRSFSYFGHGDTEVLVMRPKAIAVPATWSRNLNISYDEWRKASLGSFYISDTKYSLCQNGITIGSELNRVLVDSGTIKIHSCLSENIARKLNSVISSNNVYGTKQNMNFRYKANKNGPWLYDFDYPIPTTAFSVEMIPANKNSK